TPETLMLKRINEAYEEIEGDNDYSTYDETKLFKLQNRKKQDYEELFQDFDTAIEAIQQRQEELGSMTFLSSRKIEIEDEIGDLESSIESIEEKLAEIGKSNKSAKSNKASVTRNSGEKEELEEEISDAELKMGKLEKDLDKIEDRISEATQLEKVLDAQIKGFGEVKRQLIYIDDELFDLLNRDNIKNSFRLNISIAFTSLVAVVIIGFYIIAFRREELSKTIFSGEKGIQFVTLFLIIIAIILFGIMGQLESRELSALLGALSGYILGKTSVSKKDD
ncbi:MAG: hypothetical protein ACPGYX_06035, partial [Oceanobacter sp.]